MIYKITILLLLFLLPYQVSASDFCKKWKLLGYVYLGMTFAPEDNQKDDFLNLKCDNSFTSIDEGKPGTGYWEYKSKEKILWLYDEQFKSGIPFVVKFIKGKKLILIITDEGKNLEMEYLAE